MTQSTGGPTSSESFLANPSRAVWAAGGMLGLVAVMAVLVPAGPLGVDRSWSGAMHHLETPLLTHLALVVNWLGRWLGRSVALTLVGLLLLRQRRLLALLAFAVVLLFTTPGPHRGWWWALAGLGVVGMAWSRTYLQVHWLTDVVAGALLGTGISLLVFAIAQLRQSGVADRLRRTARMAA